MLHRANFFTNILVLFFLLVAAINALGQANDGSIEGVVRDSAGAVIIGASIELRNKGTVASTIRKTTSNEEGVFIFSNVVPGNYVLTFSKVSYRVATQEIQIIAGRKSEVLLGLFDAST